MPTSIRTKGAKKQLAFTPLKTEEDVVLARAITELEDIAMRVLDATKGHAFHDVDFLYWDRKLKNIATLVTQALNEYMGAPRFHEHYTHDPKNYDKLLRAAGPDPLQNLLRVARDAVIICDDLYGVQDVNIRRMRTQLEFALKQLLRKAVDYRVH